MQSNSNTVIDVLEQEPTKDYYKLMAELFWLSWVLNTDAPIQQSADLERIKVISLNNKMDAHLT